MVKQPMILEVICYEKTICKRLFLEMASALPYRITLFGRLCLIRSLKNAQ